MAKSLFKTNPVTLEELLKSCEKGVIQLPEFQRSWVWDDDRIRSLIASVSQAFPVGALMTLETGGPVKFQPRTLQGAPQEAEQVVPQQLLLDGQQRMTSLYQTCMRKQVVETAKAHRSLVKRWYYIDMKKALDPSVPREEAIVGVPEDRIVRVNFGKDIVLDLSTREREYEAYMFPANQVFDWEEWQEGFGDYWIGKGQVDRRHDMRAFRGAVLQNFKSYQVPVITLDRETSREAVCLVFEKVNTGGKPLDAFELVTAMYAAQGFLLRDDWLGKPDRQGHQHDALGRHGRLRIVGRAAGQTVGVLAKVSSKDFLQAVSLVHTLDVRETAAAAGSKESELPAVTATRQALLDLPLHGYQKHAAAVEEGFNKAAKFMHQLKVYRPLDVPYESQFVPLAAILSRIGSKWEHMENRKKIAQWLWAGVFGELYGSATESRFAKDIVEVPAWLEGGDVPTTIKDSIFGADRLLTMRMRLSAAYKGINALLMEKGASDFRSRQPYEQTVFFDESVDIHHIFPAAWCRAKGIPKNAYDSIINKTPLGSRTNRILGGSAPSEYVRRLESGGKDEPPIAAHELDRILEGHLIDPARLRADDFDGFMADRQARLLRLVEDAMGKSAYAGHGTNEPEEDLPDEEEDEAGVQGAIAA